MKVTIFRVEMTSKIPHTKLSDTKNSPQSHVPGMGVQDPHIWQLALKVSSQELFNAMRPQKLKAIAVKPSSESVFEAFLMKGDSCSSPASLALLPPSMCFGGTKGIPQSEPLCRPCSRPSPLTAAPFHFHFSGSLCISAAV